MVKKSVKTQEIRELMAEYGITGMENADIEPLRDLREAFESREDERFEPYAERLLPDIVMITLTRVLANADEWSRIASLLRRKRNGWEPAPASFILILCVYPAMCLEP
jgi:hypothetical protein